MAGNKCKLNTCKDLPFSTGAFFREDRRVAMAFSTKLISATLCLKQEKVIQLYNVD